MARSLGGSARWWCSISTLRLSPNFIRSREESFISCWTTCWKRRKAFTIISSGTDTLTSISDFSLALKLCVRNTSASITMATYGYQVASDNDPYTNLVEKVNIMTVEPGAPGSTLVDLFPVCGYTCTLQHHFTHSELSVFGAWSEVYPGVVTRSGV